MIWSVAIVVGVTLVAVGALLGYRIRFSRQAPPCVEDERLLNLMDAMSVEVAHQVRNPLSSLKGHAQLLSRNLPEADLRNRADYIVRESVRLEKAVSHALALWDVKRWRPRPIDPSQVAHAWVASVRQLEVRLDVTRAPSRWTMDPDRFVLVLNLLLRAILARRLDDQPIDLVVARHEETLIVLFGALTAVSGLGREWKVWKGGDILFKSSYSIAEHLAQQHKGRVAVWETKDRVPLFRLTLGKL
jgi:two-component system sensor histidine kinase HydH